jgi:hypothetical protein
MRLLSTIEVSSGQMFVKPILTIVFSSLCGCFTTHLNNYENTPGLDSLVSSAEHALTLNVVNPSPNISRGFQFLLGILPTSRVFTENLEAIVTSRLQFHAGSAGYGLTPSDRSPHTRPGIIVNISGATINGYDLLFIRRPSASVTLEGTLFNRSGIVTGCVESGSYSDLSKFAFESDLTRALESAADQAAQKLSKCLGIGTDLAVQDLIAGAQ